MNAATRNPPSLARRHALCALAMALFWAGSASAITIQFDYRFDAQGFFDPATPDGAAARASLEAAGQIGSLLGDSLLEIDPAAGESWTTGGFLNPGGFGQVWVTDLYVPADTLIVFVGGRALTGALGFAGGTGIFNVSGDTAFEDRVRARGQTGALGADANDVGPWGGAITFSSSVPWHFGAGDPAADQQDFFTTAQHELMHILGYGSRAWYNLVDEQGFFQGPLANAVFGGPVPTISSHWVEGTVGTVDGVLQETQMDPSTPRGVRQRATDLDIAALGDIGWQLVPEPGTGLLMGLGLLLLGRPARSLPSARA
ncbi:MAG: PEP-CTERM sorting domain-containing protein [Myxococcota bacterium]